MLSISDADENNFVNRKRSPCLLRGRKRGAREGIITILFSFNAALLFKFLLRKRLKGYEKRWLNPLKHNEIKVPHF